MSTPFPHVFSAQGALEEEYPRVLVRISHRLEKIRSHPSTETLHEIRVLIKLLRSLLWLAKPSFPAALRRNVKKRLQEAAQLLAAPREATALRSTLKDLQEDDRTGEPQAFAWALRTVLPASPGKPSELRPLVNRAVAGVGKAIHLLNEKSDLLTKLPSPAKVVKRAFRDSAKACREARRENNPVLYHEWRKKAKRLLYLLQVLQPKLGRKQVHLMNDVDKIQHKLGDHHDGFVLAQKLQQNFRNGHAQELKPLQKMLRQRQQRLQRKALKLSRRLP